MNTVAKAKFAVKPVVAAVALAVSAGGALADPNINALPGGALIRAVTPGSFFLSNQYTVSGGGVAGDTITNAAFGTAIIFFQCGAAAKQYGVIQWGGAGAPVDANNPNGFNIGSGAKLIFATAPNGFANDVAILNIDASKNPSQIFGQLQAAPTGAGDMLRVFVSNANGVIVGPQGHITLPNGGGLIGADLNNATSIADFMADNAQGVSYINFSGGLSEVWVQKGGAITGLLTGNVVAPYILLAGGNVVNEGQLLGTQVDIAAGIIASPGKDTVGGVAGTVVNRVFSTQGVATADWPTFGGFSTVNGDLGTANPTISVAAAPVPYAVNSKVGTYGTVVNLGNITTEGGGFGNFVGISAANGIRSGTLGDGNLLVGINSDGPLVLNTYTDTAKTELYNVVSGYTTNPILPFLTINQSFGSKGDVIINALTPASQPSSITTTGEVIIAGGDVTISSTINHLLNSAGGKQTDVPFDNFDLKATKGVTISADIGAGRDVVISGNGPINISGNLLSDTNKNGTGGIYIFNYGNLSGNTTISGNLATAVTSENDIWIYNSGQSNSKVVLTGTITTHMSPFSGNTGDVQIYSRGNLDVGGAISASDDVRMSVYGNSLLLKAPITADTSGTNGVITIAAPTAQTKLYPAAVLTAPTIILGFDGTFNVSPFGGQFVGVHNFQGVSSTGLPYTASSQKPPAQLVTNNLVLDLLGSFNAPVDPGTNTNWLLNSMPVAAQDKSLPVAISLSAVGAGFQAINMQVEGDVVIDSGRTFTPFRDVPLTSGLEFAGGLIGNGGSQLIVQATGNIDIVSNSGAQNASWIGGPGFDTGIVGGEDHVSYGNALWQFPGGQAFITPNTLNQFVPMYNAWTVEAVVFQGTFLEASVINAFGYYALNGNSWVNFSTLPTAGVPTAYQIRQFGDGMIFPISFGFQAAPDAPHLNAYTKVLTGTPVNSCPIGFVC